MSQSRTLQEFLEVALKMEGLYSVVPEDRRESFLKWDKVFAWSWLTSQWISQFVIILYLTEGHNWLAAVIIAPSLLALFVLFLVVYGAVRSLKGVPTDELLMAINSQTFGLMAIIAIPVALAAISGIYLRSFWVVVYQLVAAIALIGLYILIFTQRFRVFVAIDFLRTVLKLLGRSISLILTLFPVLLVIVLLSVFSEDLWSVLGPLSFERLVGGTALIILPAIVLIASSLDATSRKILGTFPQFQQIVEEAAAYPIIRSKLERGFVSKEEWIQSEKDLLWRDAWLLDQYLTPILLSRIKIWLVLLLSLSTSLIVAVFFTYFYILFALVLTPTIIAKWTAIPLSTLEYYSLYGSQPMLWTLHSTDVASAKVSLILSVFIALASAVYSFT